MRSVRLALFLILAGTLGRASSAQVLDLQDVHDLTKLDSSLLDRAAAATGTSRVIVRAKDSQSLDSVKSLVHLNGGSAGRRLSLVNGQIVTVPNAVLRVLARHSSVKQISLDRPVVGSTERTGGTIGSTFVRQELGFDGTGIGVAVIDSGVTAWHDDLAGTGGGQRVARFVDFVGGQQFAYDDYGHGTHVAGIVAGNGYDSDGKRSGIAPGAHLVVLKVLDSAGRGHISDVIAALEYVVAHKDELNIRVVNLSVAAGVYESFNSDPLTLAAREAVKAGIVVVAAAGNFGRSIDGHTLYGGITAPGNAPWVLTVGGSSHNGTVDRADDTMATFSSRGPTALDATAKPDVVAPGVGIESLSNPDSLLYTTRSQYLLAGTIATTYLPYLSLSGTSMASPVVSGTVALMLQANPSLTPNAVKAILQYTAQTYDGFDPLTQGAGFLNAKGAVELARYLQDTPIGDYPSSSDWSSRITWGNHQFDGGRLSPYANAWATDVIWGANQTAYGIEIEWGFVCNAQACDHAPLLPPWGVGAQSQNVVWGNECGGSDCTIPWTVDGAAEAGTVVWGTDDADTVVWGTEDSDTVVWGTTCAVTGCEPVLWPH